jgi:hypothetical protein
MLSTKVVAVEVPELLEQTLLKTALPLMRPEETDLKVA